MKITLVRHAEVIKEYQGRYNGHIDIGLSQHGETQAKELAKQLENIHFDAIYCSDLRRAIETLSAFTLRTKPIYTALLREKSWGRHEGKSFAEIEEEGIRYENFTQFINALDGEDVEVYIQRIKEFFYETLFTLEADNVLVLTHSGVIKTLLHLTKEISLEEAFCTSLPYSSFITLDTMSL